MGTTRAHPETCLIIVEKPAQYRIAKDYGLIPPGDDVVCLYGFGLWRAKLPGDLSLADVPVTPVLRTTEPFPSALEAPLMLQDGYGVLGPEAHKGPGALEALVSRLSARLSAYREIITFVDADHGGQWAAHQLIDRLDASAWPPIRTVWNGSGMDRYSVVLAWTERQEDDPRAKAMVGWGCIKRLFDYQWACNAMLVFGELMKHCGLKPSEILSKNMLLALSVINQRGRTRVPDFYAVMSDWQGTGAYADHAHGSEFGSPTSRNAIVENLLRCGAIIEDEHRFIEVTEAGKRLLSHLHPRTIDIDLPLRLASWCDSGETKAPVRYIRTLFGRQLRYQRKMMA